MKDFDPNAVSADSVAICDACRNPATVSKKANTGFIHRACKEHAKYLAGWVRDDEQEWAADGEASRRAERDYE